MSGKKGLKDVISGFFGKTKDNKGGTKDKKKEKNTSEPGNEGEHDKKKNRSRSNSVKDPLSPLPDGENVGTPPATSNGRGSHVDEGNTTGDVHTQDTNIATKMERSPSPSITGNQTESITSSGSSGSGGRPQSPIAAAAVSPQITTRQPSPRDETNHRSKSPPPTTTTEEHNKQKPATLSPEEMYNRRKSPGPGLSPKVHDHLMSDKASFNASSSMGELPSLDVKSDADTKEKKKSGMFVPLPFAPKIEDTPPPKQRASGPPEILPDEITYENSDLMGHGSFGSVYKGRCRGQEVAVKVPKKQKLTMAELTSFRNEVKIMSVIYHPHVVLFLGACTQLGKMRIVTELCFTDMEKYLASDREKKQASLSRRMQMARDAALGVNWLHSKCRIVHLDLKSANLLLDNNLRVKVTDFGFSQIKDTLSADKAKKGTPLWMAPEVMMGNKYDEKADVYSFGIILWEILTRDVPYAHHNDYATFFRAVCIEKERPPIPPNTLPSLTHLITS